MKKIGFLTFFYIFFLCIQLHAETKDIIGYGKTSWGMSLNEVLTAEPRAVKISQPETFPAGEFKEGIVLAVIRNIDIIDEKFDVLFLFNKSTEKLVQVKIKNAIMPVSFNTQLFQSLEKSLTEKYGPPTYKSTEGIVSWKFEKTSIELELMILGFMPGSKIWISYEPSVTRENSTRDL